MSIVPSPTSWSTATAGKPSSVTSAPMSRWKASSFGSVFFGGPVRGRESAVAWPTVAVAATAARRLRRDGRRPVVGAVVS